MSSQLRILLATDDDDFQEVVRDLLQTAGYEVSIAMTGGDAITMLQANQKPDVLLLDLMMSKFGSLDIMEKMSMLRLKVPTVFISAQDFPPTVRTVLQASSIPYLIKPFHSTDLLATIEKVLGSSSLLRRGW